MMEINEIMMILDGISKLFIECIFVRVCITHKAQSIELEI